MDRTQSDEVLLEVGYIYCVQVEVPEVVRMWWPSQIYDLMLAALKMNLDSDHQFEKQLEYDHLRPKLQLCLSVSFWTI